MEQGTGQFAGDIANLESQDTTIDTTVQTTAAPSQATADTTTDTTTDTTVQTTAAPNADDDKPITVIDQLKTIYGVTEEFENSVEGLQQFVDALTPKQAEKVLEEKFTKYPVMRELEAHLEAGKSLESFFNVKQVETSKLPLYKLVGDEKKDAETKAYFKEVIKADALEKGLTEKQINRMIEAGELEGTIEEDYKEAVQSYNGRRDAQALQLTQAEEQQRLADIEEQKEVVTKINTLIDAGIVGEAIIPKAEREEFKKFQLLQDDKGITPRDKAIQALSLEKSLLIDYLIFKDFKIKGLTFTANKTQQLADLNDKRKGTLNNGTEGNAAEGARLPDGILQMDFSRLQTQ